MTRLSQKLRALRKREDGTAAVEFVLAVPVIMAVFMASFESGFFMLRSVMLEQALDMTMREARLGHYPNIDAALLRSEVCSRSVIFSDCDASLSIEMTRVSPETWDMPGEAMGCRNRSDPSESVVEPEVGAENELMMVRACIIQNALFPSTGLAVQLDLDPSGGYSLYAKSAFVVEPTS